MNNIYQNIYEVISNMQVSETMVETMILNGKSDLVNGYLQMALTGIRSVLVNLSNAEFEVSTAQTLNELKKY